MRDEHDEARLASAQRRFRKLRDGFCDAAKTAPDLRRSLEAMRRRIEAPLGAGHDAPDDESHSRTFEVMAGPLDSSSQTAQEGIVYDPFHEKAGDAIKKLGGLVDRAGATLREVVGEINVPELRPFIRRSLRRLTQSPPPKHHFVVDDDKGPPHAPTYTDEDYWFDYLAMLPTQQEFKQIWKDRLSRLDEAGRRQKRREFEAWLKSIAWKVGGWRRVKPQGCFGISFAQDPFSKPELCCEVSIIGLDLVLASLERVAAAAAQGSQTVTRAPVASPIDQQHDTHTLAIDKDDHTLIADGLRVPVPIRTWERLEKLIDRAPRLVQWEEFAKTTERAATAISELKKWLRKKKLGWLAERIDNAYGDGYRLKLDPGILLDPRVAP